MKILPYPVTVEYSDFYGDITKREMLWKDKKLYFLDSTDIFQESSEVFCVDDCRYVSFRFCDNGIRDIQQINFNVVIDDFKEEFCLPPCNVNVYYVNDHHFNIRLSHLIHKEYRRVYLYVNWIRYRCENKISSAPEKVLINCGFTRPTAKARSLFREICTAREKLIMSSSTPSLYKSSFPSEVESKAWELYPVLREQFSSVPELTQDLNEYMQTMKSVEQARSDVVSPINVPINCYFDQGFYSTLFFVENCAPVKKCLSSGESAVQYTVQVDQSQLEVLMILYYFTIEKRSYFQYMNEDQRYLQDFLFQNHPAMRLKKALDNIDAKYGDAPLVKKSEVISAAREALGNYFGHLDNVRTSTYKKVVRLGKTDGKWVSEYKLFMLVRLLFPDAIYQYSDVWLEQQTLDIYIPSIKVAVEYQGEQHFVPTDFFGGEEKYRIQKKLDQEKRNKCCRQGVTLVEWHHSRPIKMSQIVDFLCEYIPQNDFSIDHMHSCPTIPDICTMKELFCK